MVRDDLRHCDTCGDVIPRGTPYRSGWTTPDMLDDLFVDAPAYWPTCDREPDGTVRFDICFGCVSESATLEHLTTAARIAA